ncbi:MAG TPA: MBL fold metallo-hydrolase [Dehalococcoidia bacterium]|nr:MBL fold metallo-hydrolase [Dehalococcoidia bacterium]
MAIVAEDSNIKIIQLDVAGTIVSNAYLLICQKTGDSALVDTPGEASKLLEQMKDTNPRYVLITHNHFDHLMAFDEVRSKLNVPVAAHPLDALPSPPDILLNDGDTVSFGNIELKVLHTPGHTPGSICFYTDKYLISGDTLFPGGPGKTRSPEALQQIIESITTKILGLPDETQVFSGHGDPTVLKKEKEEIAIYKSRSHDPNLCGDIVWLTS